MKNTEKQDFIGKYLDKKMKNCNLPYGMAWVSKVARHEEAAEKLWAKKEKQKNKTNI